MPEGDTIFRAAQTLHRALAGQTVTRFESVLPRLMRIDSDRSIAGRLVERVEARGKHLLIWFSGDLVLRTHMRMHGSWHIYRPGERWQRARHEMRIVIETAGIHAVAFSVPEAEFETARSLETTRPLRDLGPDPLSKEFIADAAVDRLLARGDGDIADALLDQTALAGIGNEFKSEILFLGRVHPFTRVGTLEREQVRQLVTIAAALLRQNTSATAAMPGRRRSRNTTGRIDPSAALWVYGRAGQPCRRCGTPISFRKQGPFARGTYWCASCQPEKL